MYICQTADITDPLKVPLAKPKHTDLLAMISFLYDNPSLFDSMEQIHLCPTWLTERKTQATTVLLISPTKTHHCFKSLVNRAWFVTLVMVKRNQWSVRNGKQTISRVRSQHLIHTSTLMLDCCYIITPPTFFLCAQRSNIIITIATRGLCPLNLPWLFSETAINRWC